MKTEQRLLRNVLLREKWQELVRKQGNALPDDLRKPLHSDLWLEWIDYIDAIGITEGHAREIVKRRRGQRREAEG